MSCPRPKSKSDNYSRALALHRMINQHLIQRLPTTVIFEPVLWNNSGHRRGAKESARTRREKNLATRILVMLDVPPARQKAASESYRSVSATA